MTWTFMVRPPDEEQLGLQDLHRHTLARAPAPTRAHIPPLPIQRPSSSLIWLGMVRIGLDHLRAAPRKAARQEDEGERHAHGRTNGWTGPTLAPHRRPCRRS